MQAREAPVAEMRRNPIDRVRHIAQLLLIAEPGTAADLVVRRRWSAQLSAAADEMDGTPGPVDAAEQARILLERAKSAVAEGTAALGSQLADQAVTRLVVGADMFAHHAGVIALPDGRTLRFEGTMEIEE
jgi:hypothetical protein